MTLRSNGPNLLSFREAAHITGTQESRRTCDSRVGVGPKEVASRKGSIVAGDKIIVFVHVRVRLKDSTEWHERRLADVFTFRNGKALRAFADRRQALEWAGVKGSDAN